MNPERCTAPKHTDPKAFAGLTQRRRERGLPVGNEGMPALKPEDPRKDRP